MTSYVKSEGRLQKRHAIRNVVQPTRNLYHFRCKSYGPLCDFHKSGDLDLELYPIFKKNKMPGSYELPTLVAKRIRTIGPVLWPVHPSKTDKHTDRQTDRQTNRGDQYTLQKSTILQSNKRGWIHNIRPTTLANVINTRITPDHTEHTDGAYWMQYIPQIGRVMELT